MTVAYSRSRYGESFRIAWLDDPRGDPLHSQGVMGLEGPSKGAQGYF